MRYCFLAQSLYSSLVRFSIGLANSMTDKCLGSSTYRTTMLKACRCAHADRVVWFWLVVSQKMESSARTCRRWPRIRTTSPLMVSSSPRALRVTRRTTDFSSRSHRCGRQRCPASRLRRSQSRHTRPVGSDVGRTDALGPRAFRAASSFPFTVSSASWTWRNSAMSLGVYT